MAVLVHRGGRRGAVMAGVMAGIVAQVAVTRIIVMTGNASNLPTLCRALFSRV